MPRPSRKWYRSATGRIDRLQINPTMSNPAIRYMRRRVHVHALDARRDLVVADAVDQQRPEDARHGPRRQQPAVDRADVHRAEKVFQVRRHRRKPAAVHADDHRRDADEERRRCPCGPPTESGNKAAAPSSR